MSLKPRQIPDIPEEKIRIAKAAFRRGNLYMKMRDELGTFFRDEQFLELYPPDGQSAFSPWRLALICILQFAENLSDRQVAEAVRGRIDWEYALSLGLGDAGFDFSILSEFRSRWLENGAETQLFQTMLSHFSASGLLKTGGKQRTDSSHILAATHRLNQLELVHETLRHALNVVAQQAAAWLKQVIPRDWFERYSQRTSNYLLPTKESERLLWVEQVGRDGLFLLDGVYRNGNYPEIQSLAAVEILRQVWIQNFHFVDKQLRLRDQASHPPSAARISSPYDLEARFSSKREISWTGYKVHLTETCNEDSPNLITNVETRASTEPDHTVASLVHEHLAERQHLPIEHYVDKGYMSVEHLVRAEAEFGIVLIGSVPDDNSWQARQQGYDSRQFKIDWLKETAICPRGHLSCSWSLAETRSQRPVVKIKFRHIDCADCPVISQCPNNHEKRRTLTILAPQSHFEAQQTARQRQETTAFKEACATRTGVEGTISQAMGALGARRSRYRGMARPICITCSWLQALIFCVPLLG